MRIKFVSAILLVAVLLLVLPGAALAKKGTLPANGTITAQVKLTPVNGSGATGHALLKVSSRFGILTVKLDVMSLDTVKPHSAAICGFATSKPVMLPGPGADTNKDGLISRSECDAVAGAPLLMLTPFPDVRGKKKIKGNVTFEGTAYGDAVKALDLYSVPLSTRSLVVYGVMQQPTYTVPFYDAKAPAAAGLIR